MHARCFQTVPPNTEARHDHGQHSSKRHYDQLIITIRVARIIPGVGMHLRKDQEPLCSGGTDCESKVALTEENPAVAMVCRRNDDRRKHCQWTVLSACPKHQPFMSPIGEAGQSGGDESIASVSEDVRGQQEMPKERGHW